MDLLDFDGQNLYFDEPMPDRVNGLIIEAGEAYQEASPDEAERLLLRAYLYAPEQLTVLVALYRFYYYRNRLEEGLLLAHRAMQVAGRRIGFPDDWRQLSGAHLSSAVLRSMGLVRFYLLALKAAGFVSLRRGELTEGKAQLCKVKELDDRDRLGAGALIEMLDQLPGQPTTTR